MDRIINLIEAELKRQEDEIKLLKWQIEDLKKEIEEQDEIIAGMRLRRPFAETIKNKENKDVTV